MTTRPWRLAGTAAAGLLAAVLPAAGGALAAAPTTGAVATAAGPAGTAYVSNGELYLTAGFGARNYVVLSTISGGRIYVTDNIPIVLDRNRAGGCFQPDQRTLNCPPSVTQMTARLGDSDDYFGNYSNITTHVYGDYGNDDLWGWFGVDNFHGGPDNDELYGLPGADRLWGDEGDDIIEGHEGGDTLYGGTGNDTMRGNEGDDYLFGHEGTEDMSGGPGRDDLDGGPGLGSIRGDDDNDVFYHTYWQNESRNDYWGGAGIDAIRYAGMPTGVYVTLNDVADDHAIVPVATGHNVHADIENVLGTDNADVLIGSHAANVLIGARGDDRLEGRDGDDTLRAYEGNNQKVYGGAGSDACDGDNLVVLDQCERVPF